jgi:UrcA family protein
MNTRQQRTGTAQARIKAGLVACAMGLMVSGMTAPASAGQFAGPDVTVRYADLDITTSAGAESLYERIQQAAARVCPASDRTLVRQMAAERCRNEVVAQAVDSLSNPRLTAIYAARMHHAAHSPV